MISYWFMSQLPHPHNKLLWQMTISKVAGKSIKRKYKFLIEFPRIVVHEQAKQVLPQDYKIQRIRMNRISQCRNMWAMKTCKLSEYTYFPQVKIIIFRDICNVFPSAPFKILLHPIYSVLIDNLNGRLKQQSIFYYILLYSIFYNMYEIWLFLIQYLPISRMGTLLLLFYTKYCDLCDNKHFHR